VLKNPQQLEDTTFVLKSWQVCCCLNGCLFQQWVVLLNSFSLLT